MVTIWKLERLFAAQSFKDALFDMNEYSQGLLEIPVAPKEIWRRYCPQIDGVRDIQMSDINRIKAKYCSKGAGSRTDFHNMCLTLQRYI